MNKQKNGIGWTRVWGRPGYTWNPISGCFHGCGWYPKRENGRDIPSVICYAKALADRMKSDRFYPDGFESAYLHEDRLAEPGRIKEPSGIFISSMGDLMGHWNSVEKIQKILDMCANNSQHIFFILTKNFPRLRQFTYPKNVWVGISSPPDFMNGHYLNQELKIRYMTGATVTLIHLRSLGVTTFVSFEPLSWDVTDGPTGAAGLSWAIIGAGSNGPKKIQPEEDHVRNLLTQLDHYGVPVYFKENLKWHPDRKEFPAQEKE